MAKAKESQQVRKARQKLQKQLTQETRRVTPEALTRSMKEIRQWISRHAGERINLKEKDIALFDENQHTALVSSHYVQELYANLHKEPEQEAPAESLKGRVTKDEGETKEG